MKTKDSRSIESSAKKFGNDFRIAIVASALLIATSGASAAVDDARATNTPSPTVLSEQQALNEVLLSGPRAAAIRAQLGISKSALVQATVLPNPGIEFDNGYAELSYRLGIVVPIEPPWKIVLRLTAARAQVGTAMLQIEQSLWTLRGDCRRAFTEFVVAKESEAMLRQLTELTRQLAQVATKRFQVGDVAKLDVFKADLAQQQAELDANQASRRVVQAREQLNIIMGRNEESGTDVPSLPSYQLHGASNDLLPDLSRPLPALAQFVNDGIQHRLEVRIVRQQMVANKAGLKNTIGNILPNGQISFGKDKQENPPDGALVKRDYLMGGFPLPVFDFQQGELARIRATQKQLDFELVAQQNIVRGQIALAYRKLWNARENIRKYQDGVIAQSEKVAELGRVSYRLGQTDITAALTAQQANIQIRNLYLNEILNYQQAFTDLEQSVGHIL